MSSAPPLNSFLSSIGVQSLSSQIVLPTSPTSKPPVLAIRDRLQGEIDNVNDQTIDLLKDHWSDFKQQLEQGDQLLNELHQQEDELKSLEQEIDGPDAFLPELVSHLESHQSLVAAHTLSTHTVTLLSTLLEFHTTISTLSDSITSGSLYPDSISHLKRSIEAVEEGTQDWIEATDLWKLLCKWQHDEQARLETALENAFESAFDFTIHQINSSVTSTTAFESKLELKSLVRAGPNGRSISLIDVLRGLEEFAEMTGRQSKVEGLLARVSKQVLRGFIAPFLEANGTIRWNGEEESRDEEKTSSFKFSFPSATEENVETVVLQKNEENEPRIDPIEGLSSFLTFFTAHSSLFNDPTSRYTSILTASLTPSIQSYLITSHLVPSLPSSTSHLTSYLSLLSRCTSFESDFLPKHHLFAFLPPSSTSTTTSTSTSTSNQEESHIVSTWSKSVPVHYARALSDRALARVRSQVKSWDWGSDGGEMVEVEVREDEEMEGLLRGLELGLIEEEEEGDGRGRARGDEGDGEDGEEKKTKEKRRRTELETVPKGAKREMTLEEATAPRPPRKPRTPTPPPPPPPAPSSIPESAVLPPPTKPTIGGGRKMKLGAAKITSSNIFLPPRSPSPPPMFQGNDLNLPPLGNPTSTSTSSPPLIASSTPTLSQLEINNSRSSNAGTPILSPRPISIPSAASFTDAQNDAEVHAIVERAQRTIAEEGDGIFEPLEEIVDQEKGGEGVEMLIKGEDAVELNVEDSIRGNDEDGGGESEVKEEEGETVQLTAEALERREEEEEDVKPFIKEESVESEIPMPTNIVVVEPQSVESKEVKVEEEEALQETSAGAYAATPQAGDFEPTPQPPPVQFYSVDDYAPPTVEHDQLNDESYTIEAEDNEYAVKQERQEEDFEDPRQIETASEEPTREPEIAPSRPLTDYLRQRSPSPPQQAQSSLPPPPPPPRARTQTQRPAESVAPPPRTAAAPPANPIPPPPRSSQPSSSIPPPPRSIGSAPPPPHQARPQGILSPPPPRSPSGSVSPVNSIPPPPRQMSGSTSPSAPFPPRSQIISPPPPPVGQARYAVPPVQRPLTSPQPPLPSSQARPPPQPRNAFSPPPRQNLLSPPPSIPQVQGRASPSSQPRQSPAPITSPFSSRSGTSPRPPSRNQDGPILNHIQQRFVSPPPSHMNPYAPFSVPSAPSAPQQASYIPANDPLLADLFGSSSSSSSASKTQASPAYFAPDPPGRTQRSNSTSSQGSNMSMGGYRPSSRGSQHQQYAPQQQQQQYQPQQPYYPQQQSYHPHQQQQGGWNAQEEYEELEDRYSSGYGGGYGQSQHEAMRLRGGASFGWDEYEEDEDEEEVSDEEEEEEHIVMRLRGGASFDLGEMEEDNGNKSGDDWGFDDDTGAEEGGDEDAWGFGDEDTEPVNRTPSPPPPPSVRSAPPPTLNSPARSTLQPASPTKSSFASPTRSTFSPVSPVRSQPTFGRAQPSAYVPPAFATHAPSASISSVTTHTSTLSRPPSYSFSSTLAPPVSTLDDLEPAVEEEGEGGDDAWGFDEELEADSPQAESPPVEPEVVRESVTTVVAPVEAEQPALDVVEPLPQPAVVENDNPLHVTPPPRPITPPPPSITPPPQAPEVIHEVVLDTVDVLPPISLATAPETVEARLQVEAETPTSQVDEWGFGGTASEEPTSPEHVEQGLPEVSDAPVLSPVQPESNVEDPSSVPETVAEIETVPVEMAEPAITADFATQEGAVGESKTDLVNSEDVPSSIERALPINEDGGLEVPDGTRTPSAEEAEPFPTETPALDNAEEGHFDEEAGWGLEDATTPVSEEAADETGRSEEPVQIEEAQPQEQVLERLQPESPVVESLPLAVPSSEIAHEDLQRTDESSDPVPEESQGIEGSELSTLEIPPTPALDEAEEGHAPEADDWDFDEPALASQEVEEANEDVQPVISPVATPLLDDAEFGQAPPSVAETPVADAEVPPASTPALESVEEGQGMEEGWEFDRGQQQQPSAAAVEPSHDLPLSEADTEAAPLVISSPPLTARDDDERTEVAPIDEEVTSFPIASDVTLPAGLDTPAPVEPASEGFEFDMEPIEVAPTPTVLEEEEPRLDENESQEPESALTAPAEDLQEQAFPVEPSVPVAADAFEAPTDQNAQEEESPIVEPDHSEPASFDDLPQPLPHSDEAETSHVASDALEASLQDNVAAALDEAALLDDSVAEDDGWGLDGEEEDTVESGLLPEETFKPEEEASHREEVELPVTETLLESTPVEASDSSPTNEPEEDADAGNSFEDENLASPLHSDTVLVEPMSSSNSSGGTHGDRNMSSPEVIERSDAWDFDLEDGANAPDAEVLAEEDAAPANRIDAPVDPRDADPIVQHELDRPVLRDESTVQHIDERPIVSASEEPGLANFAASEPQPQVHTFSVPITALPESTAAPSEWDQPPASREDAATQATPPRSISPTPAQDDSSPRFVEQDAVEDDPWDLDLEDPVSADTNPRDLAVDQGAEGQPTSTPETIDVSSTAPLDVPLTPDVTETAPQEPSTETPTPTEPPSSELEKEEPVEEEEGWGWEEQGDDDQSSKVEEAERAPSPEAESTGPLFQAAAAAVSAVAVGATAAIGLTSSDEIEPEATADRAIESNVAPTDAESIEHSPEAHARKQSTGSAEGWGWDGEDAAANAESKDDEETVLPSASAPREAQKDDVDIAQNEAQPASPPVRMEKMMVSKRSKEIVQIAEEILVEALTVASPSFEHPQFSAASAPLLTTFVSLLSLYRATAAVHNSTLLASVPAIGMQFANDADWIGREVERVWKSRTDGKDLQIVPEQAREVELAIQSTRQLGRDTRQKQIAIQRAALMESLDEASGFLRTSDDNRYSTCERALQQVTHTLQRLALVWKPVMTPTALYTTLGGLVNEVLLRVLDEIEDQTDISEEESIRLNKLCKMLHDLESLFEGGQTSVGREVPIWFKFVFLSELLEASMADILFLFDHGHLVDFSPQEIVKLIRALFSDSPLRNKNIEKVLQGHPSVSPDEEEDEWAQSF